MKFTFVETITLWSLLSLGLYGAFNISYLTFTQQAVCPEVAGVHICYVVLIGYLIIGIAQLFIGKWQVILFYSGWIVVFTLAMIGTLLEIGNGSTCPKSSSGLPMCYLSLIISTSIGLLFWHLNQPLKTQTN
jgi:hypothetical protein